MRATGALGVLSFHRRLNGTPVRFGVPLLTDTMPGNRRTVTASSGRSLAIFSYQFISKTFRDRFPKESFSMVGKWFQSALFEPVGCSASRS